MERMRFSDSERVGRREESLVEIEEEEDGEAGVSNVDRIKDRARRWSWSNGFEVGDGSGENGVPKICVDAISSRRCVEIPLLEVATLCMEGRCLKWSSFEDSRSARLMSRDGCLSVLLFTNFLFAQSMMANQSVDSRSS